MSTRPSAELAGDGPNVPVRSSPACRAQNREGRPCSNKALVGKLRCRFHGGLSTGPKTPEGRARIAAAQRRRWGKTQAPAFVDPYREVDYEVTGASFMSI